MIASVHIEIAESSCNFRCKFCNNYHLLQDTPPKLSHLPLLAEKLNQLNPKDVVLQGGEITIHQEVFDFCQNLNPRMGLLAMTNGYAFDKNWQLLFLQRGNILNFSINTPNSRTYYELTSGKNFEITQKNIIDFIVQKKERKSACRVSLSMTLCKINIEEITDFFKFGQMLSVDKIRIFPDLSSEYQIRFSEEQSRATLLKQYAELQQLMKSGELTIDCSEGMRMLEKLLRERCGYDVPQYVDHPQQSSGLQKCNNPWQHLFMDDNLNTYICCHIQDQKLGNLYDNSLEEILNHNFRKKIQTLIENDDYSRCAAYCSMRPEIR
jgi:MoaA/NifB/PqqE/SkfB family radical SAM enzyme